MPRVPPRAAHEQREQERVEDHGSTLAERDADSPGKPDAGDMHRRQILGISIEELIGAETQPGKRGPTPKLQRQLEQVSQLSRSRQRFISEMLDTVSGGP